MAVKPDTLTDFQPLDAATLPREMRVDLGDKFDRAALRRGTRQVSPRELPKFSRTFLR
ncbi:MAG: hypothetical protein GTO41_00705 [Burkholderiales bacterium]|nr:hypothetical protein [Burkholderiales bacterium]